MYSFIGQKVQSKHGVNNQKVSESIEPMQVSEPLPAAPSLSEFVMKTQANIAKFVEVDEVEESGYKNVVKLDNKTFKDEFRKVLYFIYV